MRYICRLKKLQSDFLPEIFRLVEFDGSLYVVEEFIEGQTLDEILQYEGTLKENQAALILLQLCDCLNQLHALKIVHRDLKPANIMLTRENRIKLIDLGISRIEKESRDSDTQLLGTRGYAPPEQFGFRQTDSRSDIYSLGVTMFQMLGENYRGYLTKILARYVELDPANRYQSVLDIALDVRNGRWKYRIKRFSKYFLTTASIIFAILIMPRHLTEELSIENLEEDVESVEIREESVEPEEEVEQKSSPTLEELRSIYRVDPVPIEELQFEDPIPLPNQIPNQNQPSKKVTRSNPVLKHFCRLLLNGQPFETEIPSSVWNSWQKSGDSILFPENYVVSLIVENRDSLPLKDLIVEICGKYVDKKTIPPNSSARFDFNIGSQKIYRSFKIDVRLICDEENFSWSGGSLGKYREFQLYLMK